MTTAPSDYDPNPKPTIVVLVPNYKKQPDAQQINPTHIWVHITHGTQCYVNIVADPHLTQQDSLIRNLDYILLTTIEDIDSLPNDKPYPEDMESLPTISIHPQLTTMVTNTIREATQPDTFYAKHVETDTIVQLPCVLNIQFLDGYNQQNIAFKTSAVLEQAEHDSASLPNNAHTNIDNTIQPEVPDTDLFRFIQQEYPQQLTINQISNIEDNNQLPIQEIMRSIKEQTNIYEYLKRLYHRHISHCDQTQRSLFTSNIEPPYNIDDITIQSPLTTRHCPHCNKSFHIQLMLQCVTCNNITEPGLTNNDQQAIKQSIVREMHRTRRTLQSSTSITN